MVGGPLGVFHLPESHGVVVTGGSVVVPHGYIYQFPPPWGGGCWKDMLNITLLSIILNVTYLL